MMMQRGATQRCRGAGEGRTGPAKRGAAHHALRGGSQRTRRRAPYTGNGVRLSAGKGACLALCAAVLGMGMAALAVQAEEQQPFLLLASTTSTRDSGLLEKLTDAFERTTGIEVRVLAVGTGRALEHGRRGDVDALLVHDPAAEADFVEQGYGLFRRPVMYNDFVLLGPAHDPAGVRGLADAPAALRRIAMAKARFASRGDDSGTHKAELRLWAEAGFDPAPHSGSWYLESGSGMGATLNLAQELDAYLLADRGTWLAHARRGRLAVLVEGDPRLKNPYGVLVVNPALHPHVKADAARRFADWLTSGAGGRVINAFRKRGEQLFFAQTPVDGPADGPVERPSEGPAQTPVDGPAEGPAQTPDEGPVERRPAERPADRPEAPGAGAPPEAAVKAPPDAPRAAEDAP